MDETGFSIGVINNIYVVVNNEELSHAIMHPGQQKQTTVIECICVEGTVLSPFISLKGKTVSASWILKSILKKEWKLAVSESGWTNNELGYIQLSEVFKPMI